MALPNDAGSSSAVSGPAAALADYRPALALLASLFFMWGCITVINDTLPPHRRSVFDLSYTQTTLIASVWFFACFVASIPSARLIERVGCKRVIVRDLATPGKAWAMNSSIWRIGVGCTLLVATAAFGQGSLPSAPGSNPIIRDRFTADPAPLVVGDRLYLYVGHDQAQRDEMFNMREWLVYSTTDMRAWTAHGPIMRVADFKWAKQDAWASQVTARNGKFWLYAAVEHDASQPGKAIAVAVSDSPTGPFVDAKGSALITNSMTPRGTHSWEDIDPTVFTDDDGTSWIAWGNRQCYIAKLKPNMIEIDGPITEITPPHFEEGPWLHKRGDVYYLTYASLDRSSHRDERVSYATAPSIQGPWTHRGELTGSSKYSFTIHPGIAQFKNNWYIFLHNAALTIADQNGAIGRRAVTVEHLRYNPDGTMQLVEQTDAGVSVPPRP